MTNLMTKWTRTLFTVGEDVFSAKQNRLSDKNFERRLACRVNKRFCPDI